MSLIIVGNPTSYRYNRAGEPVEVADPRVITITYGYDGLGNRVTAATTDTVSGAALGSEAFTYDAHGNLLSAVNPAAGITATDDPSGRLRVTTSGDAAVSDEERGPWAVGHRRHHRPAQPLRQQRLLRSRTSGPRHSSLSAWKIISLLVDRALLHKGIPQGDDSHIELEISAFGAGRGIEGQSPR